jgi:hypothetical protein
VRDAFVSGDVFAGFEMPPDVGVGDIARGHGEETEEDYGEECAVCRK